VLNSILYGNSGNGGIFFLNADSADISYSDFYGNDNGPFTGDPVPYLGQIVTVNANSDSCDQFYNIFMNPEFFDPWMMSYWLLEDSPCINAGDPGSPLDPDSTVADMGVYYYEILDVQPGNTAELPTEFVAVSNYPNPFNPSTVISYQLSVVSFVNLDIYDTTGRLISTLLHHVWREVGAYEVTFDGSGLVSGVYIYRLTTSQVSASGATPTIVSGKMALLK
jgi:hypothetical protein